MYNKSWLAYTFTFNTSQNSGGYVIHSSSVFTNKFKIKQNGDVTEVKYYFGGLGLGLGLCLVRVGVGVSVGVRVNYFRDSFSVLLRTQSLLHHVNDFRFRIHGLN